MKLANRIVGQEKVSSRKRKKVEYRRTEGGPRNTQAPFHLQDFLYFKMWKFYAVLLLLASPPVVNSKAIPIPTTLHTSSPTSSTTSLGMCAVCLKKDCATGVRRIYPADSKSNITAWLNKTEIQDCTMENLKPDAPCKMANGSLILQTKERLHFESGEGHTFNSQNSPCADLNLPPSSTPSPAPIHNVSTSAATNNSVADKKGIIIGSVIGIFIISIGVLIWKRNSRGQGQDRDHRHGNNGVPPHDAEDRDENTMEKQPLKGEVPNGNFNGVHREDDSVGTAGLLGHCDDSPV